MFPVPPLDDLQWIRGDRLDVVSTAAFTIWFVFDSGGIVQADDTVELASVDGTSEFYDPQTREGPWPFYKIVGGKISDISRPDDWTIEITFVNGFDLVVRSKDWRYESGRMTMPGRDPLENQLF